MAISDARPLVSVVINNYNYGRFLAGAIESALAQTYRPLEVIVVDDGSIDDSRAVIARYRGRVKPVFKRNGGQGSAFNAGMRAAEGDLIALLDADDLWFPEKVSAVVAAAADHPEAVLLYHRVRPVSGEGRPAGEPRPGRLPSGSIAAQTRRSGGWWEYPPTSGMTFRRSYLERVLPVPAARFRICADAYLADLAPFFGPVQGIPDVLALYRLHGENWWNDASRLQESHEAMVRERRLYELRVAELNSALARLGFAEQVSLTDHYPYWRIRYRLGEVDSVSLVIRAGLRFGAVPSLARRVWALMRLFGGEWLGRRRQSEEA